MNIKSKIYFLPITFILLLFTLMILFPSVCSSGAKIGLNLWFSSLIPALLPFIIISNIMIALNATSILSRFFHPFIGRLFHTSSYGTYAVVMGFLCGYPIGAKVVSDLTNKNKISIDEAKYLYKFVNNTSPVFIQSYIIISLLNEQSLKYMAYILIYFPTLLLGIFTRPHKNFISPNTENKKNNISNPSINDIDNCILDSFIIITKLGGYLILFSIMASIINTISLPIPYIKNMLISSVEITTGTYYISLSNHGIFTKLFFCSIATIFGGVSTIMQTKSVCNNPNLKISDYIIYRIFATMICCILYFILINLPISHII